MCGHVNCQEGAAENRLWNLMEEVVLRSKGTLDYGGIASTPLR